MNTLVIFILTLPRLALIAAGTVLICCDHPGWSAFPWCLMLIRRSCPEGG